MKKTGSKPVRQRPGTGIVLGRERFARISAVEGIELSKDARRRAAKFEREDTPPAEQIRAIIAAHRKA